LSQEERVAIEQRAMNVSRILLQAQGYVLTDTSKTSPFDFEAVREAVILKVEVKGTTADEIDSLFMTRSEVALHQSEKGRTALLIVSKITVERVADSVVAAKEC